MAIKILIDVPVGKSGLQALAATGKFEIDVIDSPAVSVR